MGHEIKLMIESTLKKIAITQFKTNQQIAGRYTLFLVEGNRSNQFINYKR